MSNTTGTPKKAATQVEQRVNELLTQLYKDPPKIVVNVPSGNTKWLLAIAYAEVWIPSSEHVHGPILLCPRVTLYMEEHDKGYVSTVVSILERFQQDFNKSSTSV